MPKFISPKVIVVEERLFVRVLVRVLVVAKLVAKLAVLFPAEALLNFSFLKLVKIVSSSFFSSL